MSLEQPSKKSEQIDEGRRRFFKQAAKLGAAAALGVLADEGVRVGSKEVQDKINEEVERRVKEKLAQMYSQDMQGGFDDGGDTTGYDSSDTSQQYEDTSGPSAGDMKN